MNSKDKQERHREYQKRYYDKHKPDYSDKRFNETWQSAYNRYKSDVLIPIQNRIDTEGFINGSKC